MSRLPEGGHFVTTGAAKEHHNSSGPLAPSTSMAESSNGKAYVPVGTPSEQEDQRSRRLRPLREEMEIYLATDTGLDLPGAAKIDVVDAYRTINSAKENHMQK